MKKQIIITVILIMATALITFVYFKNLNTPGMRTSQVMRSIPNDAALIFEFNNDKSFYDIFNNNKLFTAIIGKGKIGELHTLKQQVLSNPLIEKYFAGQNIFISVHAVKGENAGLLLTVSSNSGFDLAAFEQAASQANSGLVVTPLLLGSKHGYIIYINALKKRFYVINRGNNIFSGSFSKDIVERSSGYKNNKDKQSFILLPEQQNANSLANLYINYNALVPLFKRIFSDQNTDIFKSFTDLPAFAALSLNYRTDALMFNGSTSVQRNKASNYLELFTHQQPVINRLKDIFPSTTAYSMNFAVSDPSTFESDLAQFHAQAGLKKENQLLLTKIQAETGINLKTEIIKLMGSEFTMVTTRYLEKLAIVSVKDGSKLRLLLMNISTMTDENKGHFNYDKLPFFLLGDAFSTFRRPYFMIVDNYLVMANSTAELTSYYDIYINRKFLSKNEQYNQFDNLLAERSNVAFFFYYKNSQQILKATLSPEIYSDFESNEQGWKSFFAASFQFAAADKNFYTNFCIRLNTDTALVRK